MSITGRTISAGLATSIQGEVARLCMCIKIDGPDIDIPSVGLGPPVNVDFATDNFVGGAASNLETHAANLGGTWTQVRGVFRLDGTGGAYSQGQSGQGDNIYTLPAAPPSADYIVEWTGAIVGATDSEMGLVGRFIDVANYWMGFYVTTSGMCQLYKWVAGVPTLVGYHSITMVDGDKLALQFAGPRCDLLVNGVSIINGTETGLPGAGLVGLIASGYGVSTSKQIIHNFRAYTSHRDVTIIHTLTPTFSLGFTTHDDNVVMGGVTYEALSATQMSNIRNEVGGSPDNLDTIGLLTSDRITESDMRAGKYDNANISISLCDWGDPTLGSVNLFRGNIGDITLVDGQYTASIRSLMQRFQQQIGELTSPTCRVFRLGDARCKFNLAGNTVDGNQAVSAVVVATVDDLLTLHLTGAVGKPGYYSQGTLQSTSGLNNGFTREIKLHSNSDTLDQSAFNVVSFPAMGYRVPSNFATTNVDIPIPVGVWSSVILRMTSVWTLRNIYNTGADEITCQLPIGSAYDVVIRQASVPGTYQDVFKFGSASLAYINSIAGATVPLGIRHTAPSPGGAPYFNMAISIMSVTFQGIAGGSGVNRVVLREPFPFSVSAGDTFIITTGCDRLAGTCTQKFNNIINFRGEPNVPGTDRMIQIGRAPQ